MGGGVFPAHADQETSQHVIWRVERADVQIREKDKSGTVRVDDTALVEQIPGSVEAVQHNHVLPKHGQSYNVSCGGVISLQPTDTHVTANRI